MWWEYWELLQVSTLFYYTVTLMRFFKVWCQKQYQEPAFCGRCAWIRSSRAIERGCVRLWKGIFWLFQFMVNISAATLVWLLGWHSSTFIFDSVQTAQKLPYPIYWASHQKRFCLRSFTNSLAKLYNDKADERGCVIRIMGGSCCFGK